MRLRCFIVRSNERSEILGCQITFSASLDELVCILAVFTLLRIAVELTLNFAGMWKIEDNQRSRPLRVPHAQIPGHQPAPVMSDNYRARTAFGSDNLTDVIDQQRNRIRIHTGRTSVQI